MIGIKPTVRKGQYDGPLAREEFRLRFMRRFYDPAFEAERDALERLEAIAWEGYEAGRKAPVTVKAGQGYADPDYDLSQEWKETRDRLERAEAVQRDPDTPSRVLVIVGAARNDGTCPGEVSKSWRLARRRTCWISAAWFPNMSTASIPARAACRPRCPCAIGHAAAIRTTRWGSPTTPWPASTSNGSRPMA
jgi:hypothetical protein